MKTYAITKWIRTGPPEMNLHTVDLFERYDIKLAHWLAFKEDPRVLLVKPNLCIVEIVDFRGKQAEVEADPAIVLWTEGALLPVESLEKFGMLTKDAEQLVAGKDQVTQMADISEWMITP